MILINKFNNLLYKKNIINYNKILVIIKTVEFNEKKSR